MVSNLASKMGIRYTIKRVEACIMFNETLGEFLFISPTEEGYSIRETYTKCEGYVLLMWTPPLTYNEFLAKIGVEDNTLEHFQRIFERIWRER